MNEFLYNFFCKVQHKIMGMVRLVRGWKARFGTRGICNGSVEELGFIWEL
jgi:hypothetical protein